MAYSYGKIGKLREQYQAEDKALPSEAKLRDEAYEELVADAMSEMLADDAAYEKLAKLKSQNRTLWEKIGEAIRAMLDKIKGALGIYKEADSTLPAEARAVRELSSDVYAKLQDLYVNAFVEADENYSGSDKVSKVSDGKFSNRDITSDIEKYQKRLQNWDKKTEGFAFVMGDVPSFIAELEINGNKIGKKQARIDATKVKSIMKIHPEMEIDIIKKLPYLLNDPMLILDSKTVNGRLVLVGEIHAKNKPVMMALEINPSTRKGNSTYVDIVKVASAYTRSNIQNLINSSNIRYINKNKDRVNDWLKVNRLQLPLPNSQSNSVTNSISEKNSFVNGENQNSEKTLSTESDTKKSARQTAMKEMRERLQANQVDTDKIIELADKYYKKTGGHMSKSRMRYKFLTIADQIMSDYDAAFEDIEVLAEDISMIKIARQGSLSVNDQFF